MACRTWFATQEKGKNSQLRDPFVMRETSTPLILSRSKKYRLQYRIGGGDFGDGYLGCWSDPG